MRERFKIFCLLFFPLSLSIAQINPGARQIALSNSDIATSDDVFSLFNNPAGLAQLDWREIGLFYSPAPFGLKELANGFIGYLEPTSYGNIGFGAMTYGFDLYRENKVSIGISKNFSNSFFLGITTNLHSLSIKNYGSDLSFSFDVGFLSYIMNDLRIGFCYKNITRSSFGKERNQIPTLFGIGVSYSPRDNSNIQIAAEKDLDMPISLRLGIEYFIIKYVALRTGFTSEPDKFTLGLGIIYSFMQFDYAIFNHQDLGLTHQIGIIISFSEDKPRQMKIKEFLGL